MQAYAQDLRVVHEIFLRHRESPPVPAHYPPVAGALAWSRGLIERVGAPLPKFQALEQQQPHVWAREETKDVVKASRALLTTLQDYEARSADAWSKDVESSSQSKLQLPLLIRNSKTEHLAVNFDPVLVRLLREVKYFRLLNLPVPAPAMGVYQQVETFRRWTGNLELIAHTHNASWSALHPVEMPLVRPYLDQFNQVVQTGLGALQWQSEEALVQDFLVEALAKVQGVEAVVQTMKRNLSTVENLLREWERPMVERKTKPVERDEFERMQRTIRQERYGKVKAAGKEIHSLLRETCKVLNISTPAPPAWQAYVDYVSNRVVGGLTRIILVSLQALFNEIDPVPFLTAGGSSTATNPPPNQAMAASKLPMLEIKLTLVDDKFVRFLPDISSPSLSPTPGNNSTLRDLVNNVVAGFFNLSTLFKRLDDASHQGTYLREMHTDPQLSLALARIHEVVDATEESCRRLQDRYEEYASLWTTDLDAHFRSFSTSAIVQTPLGQSLLNTDLFEQEINRYEQLQAQVLQKLSSPVDIQGWLRVDTAPIKQAILGWCTRWTTTYTSHIKATLVTKLRDMDAFMREVRSGLGVRVDAEGGKTALMEVMKTICDVRKASELFAEVWLPFQELISTLKRHNVDVTDVMIGNSGYDLQSYLEEAPTAWELLVKETFVKKEKILPLQMAEVEVLRQDLDGFNVRVHRFRSTFKKEGPFVSTALSPTAPSPIGPAPTPPSSLATTSFATINTLTLTSAKAYQEMDAQLRLLVDLEQEAAAFNELEELFELQISKYPEMGETRRDLKLLKWIWDFNALVEKLYEGWRSQYWSDVETEAWLEQNKELLKQLRRQGNEFQTLKTWHIYQVVEENITSMAILLPLIDELHSPAMRDRHWEALARHCQVRHLDPTHAKFTFEDMIPLRLSERRELVEELVSTAAKELKIETQLGVIVQAWETLHLDHAPHKDMETTVIKPSEEVLESLESHQMELQSMLSVDFFKDKVVEWQVALGRTEEVLKAWVSVSKSWTALESIFLASADIRAQLPEDTKRFEGIDSEFKELMKAAITTPLVVEACGVEGRLESLKSMMARLELCQKSLNEYLDLKKKLYPRFYFVSNVALLDMLANGNNPVKILPYLGDCYDGLADLRFVVDDPATGTLSTKTVDTMVAKDKECVALYERFTMEGEVEQYLNRLTDVVADTLRHKLEDGLESAVHWDVEKPREQWLFDFPAQVVLTGTQIYWTEETERALEDYENGQADAVKRYLQICNSRLSALIQLVLGELSPGDRTKIISLITLDVHARDVVQKLIDEKTEGPNAFLWQQQLRFYWTPPPTSTSRMLSACGMATNPSSSLTMHSGSNARDVDIRICDYHCKYFYEWVGNTGRLVITPLTDRCYITLTMGLRLFLGGAPAGPAGTGKTETTKDLARALAIPCYVFNCSDQMNYQTMGDIFRGLAQTGAWGCFDEFNRIPLEVLSVVATQVKTIQDAIVKCSIPSNRDLEYQQLPGGTPPVKVGSFDFMGDTISLIPSCGFFITMNPGYAGRTELPENLKALFRSCAMIRPDLRPICENMLMSEGFQNARGLAIKFVSLYQLSSELLSKQFHYDWGLRAVKSVLRVAGMLKRGEPDMDEAQILMRALRDFNTPKIPAHDLPIFLRLIADLFVGMDEVPHKINETLRDKVLRATRLKKYQADDSFVLKVCQLQELLDVRHSVMLLGPAGAGKTAIWKTLAAAHNLDSRSGSFGRMGGGSSDEKRSQVCVYETLNPKAVSSDELYGHMTLSKDWKDGVLSIIMRGMSKNIAEQGFYEHQRHKWVVLDGDIDAVWIESMNTVMDDNKVLTLVSNERVPLSDSMRLVFEINSLKNATPATVSRAGILYINETDVGWKPLVQSWVQLRADPSERVLLPGLFEKYVDALAEMTRKGYKEVTPVRLINKVSTLIYILEGFLDGSDGDGNTETTGTSKGSLSNPTSASNACCVIPSEKKTPDVLELVFIYAAVWAFGGAMGVDKQADYRKQFSDAFAMTFGQRFPKEGQCFDYYFDVDTLSFLPWTARVPKYVPIPIGGGAGETALSQLQVATVDTVRLSFLIDLLAKKHRHVMLCGTAGTGKTSILREYLRNLDRDADKMLSSTVNMSYYTDSAKLQGEIELALDRRSGRKYGPPQGHHLIMLLDDLNLPYVETYGTQNAIALLTQHLQYGGWFDRSDLGMRKEVVDVQYLAAMNPTAGSFYICERAQRHFATFACTMPSKTDLKTIYGSILAGHLKGFAPRVEECCTKIVDATIALHGQVLQRFLPSAVKFTYNWNMRELSNVFQGLTLARSDLYTTPLPFLRLWAHECERVFGDRLTSEAERGIFQDMLTSVANHTFSSSSEDIVESLVQRPLLCTNFVGGITSSGSTPGGESVGLTSPMGYVPVPTLTELKTTLNGKLQEYNESNAMMDLVLFDEAMAHVTRICRIISNPSGHAMLIGVGGSGKQSLTRLAAFICGYEVKQLAITSRFKLEDLKDALKDMYKYAGVKGVPLVFLIRDSQVIDERFLIYINALLSSGWIPDLLVKDELESMLASIRTVARAQGVPDTPATLLEFLITRIRTNLHVVLAFSPVGSTFRIRARRFPALVNCTAIDVFHPWPREALVSVAQRFLDDVDLGSPSIKSQLALHMAEEHLSVMKASHTFLERHRRYNYVTPKSFLELIGFYRYLLGAKRSEVVRLVDRLDVGLSTLKKTAADVAVLQADLTLTLARVEEKKAATEQLIEAMGAERAEAEMQQGAATLEASKANAASEEAAVLEKEASIELAAAEPAMKAAAAAVDVLSKAMLTELKNLKTPPAGVDTVTTACLILVEKEYKNHKWERAKKMMANIDQFKNKLMAFKGETIPEEDINRVTPFMSLPDFSPEAMSSKSAAAANLCTWVVNMYRYNRIYVKVKPLMDTLAEAQATKASADASLAVASAAVTAVQERLAVLEEQFVAATEEKAKVEAEAAACQERLSLAERLVNGLSSENTRWGGEIERLKERATTLVGDCMVAAGFVSYLGAFDQDTRESLWKGVWTRDLIERGVPLTPGLDPVSMLSNDGHVAQMIREGLPADRISLENGAAITNCKRWPLIIDPQTQGIKWLRQKEAGNRLLVLQLSQKDWAKKMEKALSTGQTVILENVGEELDSTLEPVLTRAIYKKGRKLYIKFCGEEVEFDPAFQLYLQTRLSNPHYRPEVFAQCTLINFIATERGLEEQLLSKVVAVERPELEEKAQLLQQAFQRYKIQLVELEDDLLERLANAPDDILSDVPLIEGLEATKAAVLEINTAVSEGKTTEGLINEARETYRSHAAEGAMLYFLLTQLSSIDHMYQYSLDSFVFFYLKSIKKALPADTEEKRAMNLRVSLRMTVYTWVSRGLFERHKLIFLAQLTFNLLKRGLLQGETAPSSSLSAPTAVTAEGGLKVPEAHFQFLLRCPQKPVPDNPLGWLPMSAWQAVQALTELDGFGKLAQDMVEASPRFREWYNAVAPDMEKLPLEWAGLDRQPFQKMMVVRCLRPDRANVALTNFIRQLLPHGDAYTDCDATLSALEVAEQALQDATPATPLYFILSAGANVVGVLDRLAEKYGLVKGVSYHNVSMGQGQDVVAMACLESAHRNGHWVILNNVHLMPRWMEELEKKLDEFAQEGGSHAKMRLFLTSDPAVSIPIGILNRCIKVTNEAPAGLKANLKRAWSNFPKQDIDDADSRTRGVLFGLCYFHALMVERKLFGPMGFNMNYPFSLGDLRDSAACLHNYLESANGGSKVPWHDLKYIFGDIMYGGHIVNDFDRLVAKTYLDHLMRDELLDEMQLFPYVTPGDRASFYCPPSTTYDKYMDYVDRNLVVDTPMAFGLHPNAEIGFRTRQGEKLFATLLELQPREGGREKAEGVEEGGAEDGEEGGPGGGAAGGETPQAVAERVATEILDRFGERRLDVDEVHRALDGDEGPYQNVFLQEMEALNALLTFMTLSLRELLLGLGGELALSDKMESLLHALYLDAVPDPWLHLSWPSRRPLGGWLANLHSRLQQLEEWQQAPQELPKVTWLAGLVNPQAFLTAVCQVTAQKNGWALDQLVIATEVTKKTTAEEVDLPSRDGAYVVGLALQGARWDSATGGIEPARPKEMFSPLPVLLVRAVPQEQIDRRAYACPVFKTEDRGPTYVFSAQLKTKSPPARWILAGVALIMDVAGG